MNIQFKKGALELCVLAMLRRRDRYGYELSDVLERSLGVADGSVYPLLRRLKEEALLETYLVEASGGPPRKYYRITEAGRAHVAGLVDEWADFSKSVAALLEADDAL